MLDHADNGRAPSGVLTDTEVQARGSDLCPRLAEVLGATGTVVPIDLSRARAAAASTGKRLDQALIELGLTTKEALFSLLPREFGVEPLARDCELKPLSWPPEVAPAFWRRALMVPVTISESEVVLGMADPFDDFSAKAIALKLRRVARRVVLSDAQLSAFLEQLPAPETSATSVAVDVTAARADDVQLLKEAASDAPVVRFVQDLIANAVRQNASDIHVKPGRAGTGDVLLRLAGTLTPLSKTPIDMLPAIVSRLKILANLDISDRRRPQDGKFSVNVAGIAVEVRLSTMPNVEGEGAVLRLLARQGDIQNLSGLGFSEQVLTGLDPLFDAENGLILVTGPTGSGKTTTLHTALRRLVRPGVNVVTIEDPVEYRVAGASQIQVDEKVGLTFATALRSVLRQDPDVILIGEIRDQETARIAVQAALTGHLVLATLHTNTAAGAVPRLIDMGVEPFLLAAVLRGVLAQRLFRRPCPHCAVEAEQTSTDSEAVWVNFGPGCSHCGGAGHLGRTAVGELITFDFALAKAMTNDTALATEMLDARGHWSFLDDLSAAGRDRRITARDATRLRVD